MPNIRSSADLRNNYNDISSYCHAYNEPVFITKNGKGDLAVMSMETYEEMAGRIELYSKLQAVSYTHLFRRNGQLLCHLPGRAGRDRKYLRRLGIHL